MSIDEDTLNVKIPTVITLKDVITFVSIAVAITMAWGVFSTRMTVAEKELVYQAQQIEQLQKSNAAMNDKLGTLEARVRDDEYTIQTLWSKRNK
jgi:hypothetical protein